MENVAAKGLQRQSGTGLRSGISIADAIRIMTVIVLWAICYPLISTGLAASPPLHFAALRSVLAGIILLGAGILYGRPVVPERSTWLLLLTISLTFTTLGFTGMFLAGSQVTPGLATVITNVQPLLAALLGVLVLSERLLGLRGLALLTGFAGVFVIAMPGLLEHSGNSTPVGIGLVLLGATGVAVGNVFLKRIANQVDPVIAMGWVLLLGAIPLVVAASVFENLAAIHWNMAFVIDLIVLSILGTALAFVMWLDILRRVDLNLLNSYTFLTPIFALVIGMLFYGERLSFVEWSGVGVIVFAVFLASRSNTDGGEVI